MSDTHAPPDTRREPGQYEIRLKGHLDARWAAWFDGLSLTQGERWHNRHSRLGDRPGRAAWLAEQGARFGSALDRGPAG